MQRIFRELGLLEPEVNDYHVIIAHEGNPARDAPRDCVRSQMLEYLTADGVRIAEAHRYLRSDGSVGARSVGQ